METRILILAPTGKDGRLAGETLARAGLRHVVCGSVAVLMIELAHGAGALVLAEEALADSCISELVDYLRQQPAWSDLPVLLLSQRDSGTALVEVAAARLGNVTILERPLRSTTLVSAVRAALRTRLRQYRVREAEQRKDEFLASLGHELRNPLAPIRAATGVLCQRYADHDMVAQLSHLIERQINHLTRLVDDLLDVARITNGKVTLQRTVIRLQDVVAHAREICSGLLEQAHHELHIRQPEHDVFIFADHARLVQSLANVLVNAIKFTPQPDVIHLEVDVDGDTVIFLVSDPGVGIEAQALGQIFELFSQSHPVPGQLHGGLGIGLSLARQFTHMHGGTIQAFSAGLGRGSQFELRLPIVCRPPAVASEEPVTQRSSGPLSIVVVDDNRDAADMLATLLQLDGHQVRAAYDGLQALELAHDQLPDLMLLDLAMPGLSGYETARALRGLPQGQAMVLVALTGWGQDDARHRARAAGFNYHLVKPVDIQVLRHLLDTVQLPGAVPPDSTFNAPAADAAG